MLVVRHEPELGQAERKVLLVEDTHDDRFAVAGRDGRDAQVQLAALHLDLDAAVLRDAALGKLHVGHELEALQDCALEAARRGFLLAQHAVDAVADAEARLHRLEVDVGGAGDERAHDDLRAELDDRGVLFVRLGAAELVLQAHRLVGGGVLLLRLVRIDDAQEARHFVVHVLVGVEHPEGRVNLLDRGDDAFDVLAEHRAQRVERLEIERVGHRHGERAVLLVEGHDLELARQIAGQQRALRVAHLGLRDVHELHAEGVRDGAEHVVFGDVVALQERVPRRFTGLRGAGGRRVGHILRDDGVFEGGGGGGNVESVVRRADSGGCRPLCAAGCPKCIKKTGPVQRKRFARGAFASAPDLWHDCAP